MVYGTDDIAEQRTAVPAGQSHASLKYSEQENHGGHRAAYHFLLRQSASNAHGKAVHGQRYSQDDDFKNCHFVCLLLLDFKDQVEGSTETGRAVFAESRQIPRSSLVVHVLGESGFVS